jgi:hypothetical protein
MSPWRRRPPGPGETPPSTAKRRHPRYLLNTPVTAVPDTEDQHSRMHSRALDISESGVGSLFQENWHVGTRVRLEISLPVDQTPLKVGAIVRHHTGMRYGFEFLDISLEQRGILRDTCKVLSKIVPGRGQAHH